VEAGRVKGVSVGAVAAARTRAKRTFGRRGTLALPKRGAATITPAIRKNARTKVGTNWRAWSRDIATRLWRSITAEHGGGESHQVIGEPGGDEDGRGDHGGNFGDEDEGLFLNLREGLEDGDGQADKEADQKQGRGDNEGNEKSLANKIAGLIYAHVTPFPKCGELLAT